MVEIIPHMADVQDGCQHSNKKCQQEKYPPSGSLDVYYQVKDKHQQNSNEGSNAGDGFQHEQKPDKP